MGIMNPNSTNYQHSWEPNVSDLHTAMDYLSTGEPALRVISNFQGNIIVQGDINIDTNINVVSMPPVDINSMPEVSVKTDSGNTLAIQGTVYQGTSPWVISGNVGLLVGGQPLATGNPIPVDITDTCLKVMNCDGTRLNTNANSIILINELPVANNNPLPVTLGDDCISIQNCGEGSLSVVGIVKIETGLEGLPVSDLNPLIVAFPEGTCIPVTNCGTDGVLSVSGNITVEGVAVTVENPFPVDLRNTCIGVQNCVGTTLDVNITNTCLEIQNCGEGSLSIIGQVSLTLDGQTVSSINPLPITGTTETTITGTNLDAVARLRVSDPYTLFDGALRYRDDPLKWSESTTSSGSITFDAFTSTITMSTSAGGTCVRESKRVFSYQPGKSLLVMASFVMNNPTIGVTQRVGFFGTENGVYFETNDTIKNIVIRKYTTGSVDDSTEKIPQSSWNGDKLDGTGASGKTLNVTKAQIWWCDLEWLGVGSVRTGFVIDGNFIVCHTFHHAGNLALVYMTTATLPVRYELLVDESEREVSEYTAMQVICSTVISEGGYVNRSIPRSIGNSLSGKNLSDSIYRPLINIRLKSQFLDAVVVPAKFEVLGLNDANYSYRIILNPTLTGASFQSAGADSSVEYDLSATALTGGTVIDQGMFIGPTRGGSLSIGNEIDFSQQLGRTLAGVSDIWCLAAISSVADGQATGTVTWQEHA